MPDKKTSSLSPEEYQKRLLEAIQKYGEDAALAFDPDTETFSPGTTWLNAAEVEEEFVPRTKEEADAYKNLGVEGALEMRSLQKKITGDRNKFAEEYMVPAAEVLINASSIGKGAQIGVKGIQALNTASRPLRKWLLKQIAKKSGQLSVKKGAQYSGEIADAAGLGGGGSTSPSARLMNRIKNRYR